MPFFTLFLYQFCPVLPVDIRMREAWFTPGLSLVKNTLAKQSNNLFMAHLS